MVVVPNRVIQHESFAVCVQCVGSPIQEENRSPFLKALRGTKTRLIFREDV